ncbi:hypothetical protein IKG60_01575 [Candidatus Saccharibacteria bacterium]|nr:hypothetical protein [Candidatus Saccharibacteria bacterium]
MKKKNNLLALAALIAAFFIVGTISPLRTFADDESNEQTSEKAGESGGTSISLMPVSKVLQISKSSEYEDTMTVTNDGDERINIEVYTAPYSYVYSEDDDTYKLGFNRENSFTQITRWIKFKDSNGEWQKKMNYSIPAHDSVKVQYKITTPEDIPAGGQYAVIFAHTLTATTSANGIRTEASPGMVIYGRSTEGEMKVAASISNMQAKFGIEENGQKRDNFYASAKIKNEGNVDFSATGKLKVDSILGGGSYETPADRGRISVIPDSELVVRDEWENSPSFGLYKVTWTVTAGESTETIETIVFVNPVPFIIITIIVLTIIIVWVTIVIRKRKERRSRLAV